MTNKTMIDRVLMAYRPLYLQGLLINGQYRLPATTARKHAAKRQDILLTALTGLRHIVSPTRNKP
ncbi:hypothetical protein ABQJ54_07610 [Rhodanobacter sp. Si-c]|uniref:Uncharacterized protein n=1 Tax=Rhodanobacter lycopersici TaxID=3162487 RepID=A0ABV3QCQ2_9GAMM